MDKPEELESLESAGEDKYNEDRDTYCQNCGHPLTDHINGGYCNHYSWRNCSITGGDPVCNCLSFK